MGDFRYTIKIQFSMGNVKDKCDMNLNWTGWDSYCGVDPRICEWISERARVAIADIRENISAGLQTVNERQNEFVERAELARLKAKYE